MHEPITQEFAGGPTLLQAVLWIALAAAVAGLVPAVRAAGLRRREWLGLGLLALLGLAVRLAAPATLLHDNSHGFVALALSRALITDGTHDYGNGFFVFWSHLFRVAPDLPAHALLHAQAVLDTLTVVGVGLLAALLSGRRVAAVFAGAAYALLPPAVKIAHTESYFVTLAFLATLGFVLAAGAARRGSWIAAVAAGLVLGYAGHVRPEASALPLLTLLLLVSAAPAARDLWRRPHAAVVLVVQFAVAAPALSRAWTHFRAGDGAASMLRYRPGVLLAALLGSRPPGEIGSLVANPAFVTPILGLLFLAGSAFAVLRRARWALFPALAPIVATAVVLPIQNADWVAMRLQHGALFLWCLLPAAALAMPWLRLGPPVRAAVAGVLLLSFLPYASLIREARAPQEEYAFLRAAVPSLPDDCTIVHPGHDREIVADLPVWLSAEAGRRHAWRMLPPDGTLPEPPATSCVFWYRGVSCHASPSGGYGAPPGGLRPACAAFERAHRLAPLRTVRITGRSDTFYPYAGEPLEIGFFRVAGAFAE